MSLIEPSAKNLNKLIKNKNILEELKVTFPKKSVEQLIEVPWLDIPYGVRNYILKQVSKGVNFEKDRAVPFFKTVDNVSITTNEGFTFLGEAYKANQEYKIDLSNFLNSLVEYASSDFIEGAEAIELHFRGRSTPGELRSEIGVFFDQVLPLVKGEEQGINVVTDHQHIIGKIPKYYFGKMGNAGYSQSEVSLGLTLYHQVLETLMIITNAKNEHAPFVKQHTDPSRPPIMNYLSRDSISEIYNYFLSLQKGEDPVLSYTLKKNNIGLRSSDTYSGKGLWGLEFRFLGYALAKSDVAYANLAGAAKKHLDSQDFPINLAEVSSYIKDNNVRDLAELASQSWWRQSDNQLRESYSDSPLKEKIDQVLSKIEPENLSQPQFIGNWVPIVALIVYRWDKHPLFYKHKSLIEKIKLTQEKYIDRMLAKEGRIVDNFNNFIQESGIQEHLESIIYD